MTFESFDELINYAKTIPDLTFEELDKSETIFNELKERAIRLTSKSGLSVTLDMINGLEFFYKICNSSGEILYEKTSSGERDRVDNWETILNPDSLVEYLIYKFQRRLPKVKREMARYEKLWETKRKDYYHQRVNSSWRLKGALERAIQRLSSRKVG